MNRQILRLAVPNILANVSVPLISSFDTVLMGELGGAYIAAVGLGAMAFNFVYWNFGFLRMSTTGLVAQAHGAGDAEAELTLLRRGALLALAVGTFLLLFQYPLAQGTHWLLNLRADQVPLVDNYFYVRVVAAPAALLQLVIFGYFFGRQNAVVPLVLTVVVNVVNMALSYYLTVGLGWGIDGVAWGTVGAQYVGLVLALGAVFWLTPARTLLSSLIGLHPRPRQKNADGKARASWRDFLRVNADIFVRTVCLTLSFAFFYNRANALDVGTATVAANVILLQLVNWLSYGIDGFAYAAESLTGKFVGAGERENLRRALRAIFAWGMVLALGYALLYGLFGRPILELFAPENGAPETLAAAATYLPLIVAFCLLATPCYLYDGIFIGLTATRAMRQTMLLSLACYFAVYLLVGRHYGNWGLWGSLLLFMVARGLLQWYWVRSGRVPLLN